MPMTDNEKRGRRAQRILKAEYKNDSRGLVEEDVIDGLTDILHLCHEKGWSFSNIQRIALMHFVEERAGR